MNHPCFFKLQNPNGTFLQGHLLRDHSLSSGTAMFFFNFIKWHGFLVLQEEEHGTNGALFCEECPFWLQHLVFISEIPPGVVFPPLEGKMMANTMLSRDRTERLCPTSHFLLRSRFHFILLHTQAHRLYTLTMLQIGVPSSP